MHPSGTTNWKCCSKISCSRPRPAVRTPGGLPTTLLPRVAQPRAGGLPCRRGEQSGRTRILPAQLSRLLDYFALDPTPDGPARARLAAEVGLTPRKGENVLGEVNA